MRIYLRNNPAKFHIDPFWNDLILRFFEARRSPTRTTTTRRRTTRWV